MARLFTSGAEIQALWDGSAVLSDATLAWVGSGVATAFIKANSTNEAAAGWTSILSGAGTIYGRTSLRNTGAKSYSGAKASWGYTNQTWVGGGVKLVIDMQAISPGGVIPAEFFVGYRFFNNAAIANTGWSAMLASYMTSSAADAWAATTGFRGALASASIAAIGYSDMNAGPTAVLTGTQLYYQSTWHYVEFRVKKINTTQMQVSMKWDMGAESTAVTLNWSSSLRYLQVNCPCFSLTPSVAGRNFYLDDVCINDTSGDTNNSWVSGDYVVGLDPVDTGADSAYTTINSNSTIAGALTGTGNIELAGVNAYAKTGLSAISGGATVNSVTCVEGLLQNIYKNSGAGSTKAKLGVDVSGSESFGLNTQSGALTGVGVNFFNRFEKQPDNTLWTPTALSNAKLVIRNSV